MVKWLTCLFLVLPLSLISQDDWTVDDIITQESISQSVFSHDGTMVAWTKRRASSEKDRFITDLYLTRISEDGLSEVQLTRTDDSDRNPFFSADGQTLYFLSSREKGKKLWAMNTMGGEAYAVHTFENGISSVKMLNDSMITFLSTEGKTLYETRLKEKKDDVVVVEDSVHQDIDRLFSFHLKKKEIRRLTTNEHPVSGYAVSKNGRWIVSSHQLSPHYGVDGKPSPTYFLWDLENGTKNQILEEGYLTPGGFSFVDGGFYFRTTQTSDPEWEGAGISLLYYFDLFSGTVTQIDLDWENGMSGGSYVAGQHLLIGLADGAYNRLGIVTKQGAEFSRTSIVAGDKARHLSILSLSKDGQQALLSYSTASHLTEFMLADLRETNGQFSWGDFRSFTELNKSLRKKTTARSEVITWTGAMDEEVTGILMYPHDYEEGRAYPLVVAIHGGPSGVDRDRWSDRWAYPHQLLTQKGMFILKPNYHGSSNHGQAFVESIKKHYYEYELPDILNGIDYLEGKGLIDRDSMAVLGWSNGAILATMLTVEHPDLFKVAAAGAGDVNWSSDFGTCGFGVTFDQSYFGGAPWDNVDGLTYNPAYILKSPLFEMEKVKTPTLIHHGSEDRAVPRDQGWEYYRALQQIGQAPVRFLWYPGQPHGLGKISHQRRKVEEEMRWISYYLFGKDISESEVMKKSSPLSERIKLMKSQHHQGHFGIMSNGILVPETSSLGDGKSSIGRFEVTNAQFAAFNSDLSDNRPDHMNHPVAGITFEQAQAYCQWLSERTGDRYRLPTREEADSWEETIMKAAKTENNLAYWAGYQLTVDEAVRFLEEMPEVESLSMDVGSFSSSTIGDATVYDLGGNVSEWVSDAGAPSVMGYGYLDYADPSAPDSDRNSGITGLRVIKE